MSLLTIPLELFECIAEETSLKDLSNLRLVSRECAAKVERTFLAYGFKKQTFWDTGEGLRRAIAIAEHPKIGAALRNIDIFVEHGHESDPCPRDCVTKALAKKASFEKLFSALSEHGQLNSIYLHERAGSTWARGYVCDWSRAEVIGIEGRCCFLRTVIFKTVRSSGLRVEGLSMDFETWFQVHENYVNGVVVPLIWSDVFSNLKTLTLNVAEGEAFTSGAELVTEVLEGLPALRELAIERNGYGRPGRSDLAFTSSILDVHLNKLKRLSFYNVLLDFRGLNSFMKRHPGLKKVIGSNIKVVWMLEEEARDLNDDDLDGYFKNNLAAINGAVVELRGFIAYYESPASGDT